MDSRADRTTEFTSSLAGSAVDWVVLTVSTMASRQPARQQAENICLNRGVQGLSCLGTNLSEVGLYRAEWVH